MDRDRNKDVGLLVLRVGIGMFMLVGHAWGKLVSFPELWQRFPDPIGLGSGFSLVLTVFAEALCSLLLVLGLGTRLAALPPLITMLVAAFVVHAGDPWVQKELALMYAIPFLTLALTGAGRYSLDRIMWPSKGD